MNKSKTGVLFLALTAGALPLTAAAADTRPYVFGGYAYTFDDKDRQSENGDGYFFGAGKQIDARWSVEFGGFVDSFDAGAGGNVWRAYGGSVDGLFHFMHNEQFSPFFLLGVGAINNELRSGAGGESTDPFVNIGVGLFKWFDLAGGNLGLRADVRGRWGDLDDLPGRGNLVEPVVRIGLAYQLGEKPAEPVMPPPDADGDGVADDTDLCPQTARGVQVDSRGCPLDSDGDGVADASDRCPQTPKGTEVDARGCAVKKVVVDSDGDGVADDRDRCPGTLKGLRVDENGCARKAQTLVLQDVNFRFGSLELAPESAGMLAKVAESLRGQRELRVEIAGHTDSVGDERFNLRLSQQRADAVLKRLVELGVDAAALRARGYGEAEPVADNTTKDGRARNRRVEFRILGD